MKCQFCGNQLKKKKVDIARYWGKNLIALNNVPALICIKCGERFFEAKVSKKIDDEISLVLKEKASIRKINIPVVQF